MDSGAIGATSGHGAIGNWEILEGFFFLEIDYEVGGVFIADWVGTIAVGGAFGAVEENFVGFIVGGGVT